MNNPASNKIMTRLGLKREKREFEYTGDQNSKKKHKGSEVQERIEEIEKRRVREGEIKGADEKENGKTISDGIKKEWMREKEAADICSEKGKKEAKGMKWSKYTVMRRRTGSLIDLARRKGAFSRQDQGLGGGTKSKATTVDGSRKGQTKSESNLLKKLLNWNHINAEKNFMDHDGLDMQ